MATLRSLNIAIRASSAYLSGDFNKASRLASQFQRDVSRSFHSLSGSILNVKTAIAAALGVAGFGALIKASFDTVDALAKQADKLGFTTQALAGLQHAAALAGIDSQKLNIALTTMEARIGDLYRGLGSVMVQFKALNLTADDLKGLSPEQQFKLIADRLNQVKDATTRATIAYHIFSQSGVDLLNVTQEGSKGLAAATAEAEKLGIALNRVDAAKIEAANDAMTRAKEATSGVANIIALQLSPYLKEAADEFVKLVEKNNGFRDAVIPTFEATARAVGFVADTIRGLEAVFTGVKVIALGFAAAVLTAYDGLNRGIAAVANGIIDNIKGPLLTALDALAPFSDTAKQAADAIRNFQGVKPDSTISEWAENARKALIEAEDELKHLINDPMPSKNIEAFFARVRANAQKAAEAVAKARQAPQGEGNLGFDFTALDDLQKSMRTQEQVIAESYARRAEIVGNALQANIIDQDKANSLLLQLDQKYQAERVQAELQANSAVTAARNAALNNAAQLLAVIGQKNKAAALAALAIQKGLAIAETLINTQVAAVRALAELGPIAGPPAAASIEALGSASVALIAATGFIQAKDTLQPKGYAKGGIVSSDSIIRVGEGRTSEAIVPLPDGRSIPVDFRGGGGQTVVNNNYNVSINATDAQSFRRMLAREPEVIASAVQQVYRRNARAGGPYR